MVSDKETAAAIQLRENIAKRRHQAQVDYDLENALLGAQLAGASYVLDCLKAPAWREHTIAGRPPYMLTIQQRIEALQTQGAGETPAQEK